MFRKNCIVFILFFAASSVMGQGMKFGVMFDPTVTWLGSDVKDVVPDKARLGFDFGITADYYFAPNYAFATGISLFNTGGTLRYDQGIEKFRTKEGNLQIAPGGKVKYKLQYVKVPVAMKFKTHRIGRFVYSANLGFDPMMLVTARASINGDDDVKANDEINGLNMGWHFGAGLQYSLGQDVALFGGLAFMKTFTDITTPAHDEITSKNLMLRIGIMF